MAATFLFAVLNTCDFGGGRIDSTFWIRRMALTRGQEFFQKNLEATSKFQAPEA